MSRPTDARSQAIERLRELAAAGVDGLPRATVAAEATERAASSVSGSVEASMPAPKQRGAHARVVQAPAAPPEVAAGAADEDWRALGLGELSRFLADCRRCKLCEGRTQVVFGVGDPNARLMFVGEGPGRDEDLQGEPFVGKAGRLLTDMIEKGMHLRRSDVYIANVVKCRPPNNRDPEPEEVAACERFLRRQVELVRPEVIVALGRFAAQTLLRTTTRIGELRGRWHEYSGIPLMPTFHPAYLLRNPNDKRVAWEDLKQVMARMGLGDHRSDGTDGGGG